MTEQIQKTPSTFWQGLGRFLWGLARLLLFAFIIAIITVAVYYAGPSLYTSIVAPIKNSQVAVGRLERVQTQMQDDLTGKLTRQSERIARLEANLAAEREVRSELESELDRQAETISAQGTAQAELAEQFETQTQTTDQTDLATRLKTQGQAIVALEQSVDALDTFLTGLDETVANVEQAVAEPEAGIADLQQQVLVLQASQATLKARLHLAENNSGQAQLALERVELALDGLEALVPPEKEEDLAEVRAQLQAVTTAIEEQPFIATQELEILWQLLQKFSAES